MSEPGPVNADPHRLDGRRILVAGAGRGIGAAVTRAVTRLGAQVACVDNDEERGTAIATEVGGAPVIADLFTADGAGQAVAQAADALGGLDGLVDIVGMWPPDHWKPLTEVDDETWRDGTRFVVDHAFRLARAAVPHVQAAGGGALVFIASISGHHAAAQHGPYGAAKAALMSLARTLAIECAPHGIRANTVSPGAVRTPRIEEAMSAEQIARSEAGIPLGRFAEPTDIANAVAFLLSDAGGYLTGLDLRVDGGMGALFPGRTMAD